MNQWFVVQTQIQKELYAQQELKKQGYEVYLPRFKKTRRHARKVDTVLAPLFPRYLFVSFDPESDPWRRINGTRGVSYLLTNDEKPCLLSSSLVESLKAQENEDQLVSLSTLSLFAKGDKVHIKEGAFEGQTAVFEKMDDHQRVHLLLTFLGRETEIKLPLYMLEAS